MMNENCVVALMVVFFFYCVLLDLFLDPVVGG